jgi:hypothetical protein
MILGPSAAAAGRGMDLAAGDDKQLAPLVPPNDVSLSRRREDLSPEDRPVADWIFDQEERLGKSGEKGDTLRRTRAAASYLAEAVRGNDPTFGELTPGKLKFLMREAPGEWVRYLGSLGEVWDPQYFSTQLSLWLARITVLDMQKDPSQPGNNRRLVESAPPLALAALLVTQGKQAKLDPAKLRAFVSSFDENDAALFGAALASNPDAAAVLNQETLTAMTGRGLALRAFLWGVFSHAKGELRDQAARLMPSLERANFRGDWHAKARMERAQKIWTAINQPGSAGPLFPEPAEALREAMVASVKGEWTEALQASVWRIFGHATGEDWTKAAPLISELFAHATYPDDSRKEARAALATRIWRLLQPPDALAPLSPFGRLMKVGIIP